MSMVRSAIVAGAICAAPFVGFSTWARAQPVPTPVPVGGAASSAAYGIDATFTGGGMSTSLGPVAPVSGTAPPAYSKTKVVTSYSGSVAIPPLVPSSVIYPIVAELTVDASQLKSQVASPGIGIDNVSSTGSASIDTVALRIINPEPVPPPIPVTPGFLTVVASGVQASASYSKVFPSASGVSGSASFGALTISGSLLGGETITYSGAVPPNTVLYQSPTLTITAHQQIIAGLISCPPCTFSPVNITVKALDISFNNAVIDGRTFSGDITLGDASAAE